MGGRGKCPHIPGRRYIDWDLPEPKVSRIEAVRATRDEIAVRVEALADELRSSKGCGSL
jgi:hypothetical protein